MSRSEPPSQIVQPLAAQLPWGHFTVLPGKTQTSDDPLPAAADLGFLGEEAAAFRRVEPQPAS